VNLTPAPAESSWQLMDASLPTTMLYREVTRLRLDSFQTLGIRRPIKALTERFSCHLAFAEIGPGGVR
jgi:hypothetical protein